jgi:hypothetical protein
MKSRSLKEAYALMFTNPSKLEAVKAKFNSIKEPEQVNESILPRLITLKVKNTHH